MERTNQFVPNYVSPPGDTLRGTIDAIGMTQVELAIRTGRPKEKINDIIQGRVQITAETAIQFEKALGIPASFWLNLEQAYREYFERQREIAKLENALIWLKQVPYRPMIKYGWIKDFGLDLVSQLREVLTFFGVASVDEYKSLVTHAIPLRFRKSANFKANPIAVAAWLRQGIREAQKVSSGNFDEQKFKKALVDIRGMTTLDPSEFVPRMVSSCLDAGVILVFTKELPNTSINGAARWIGNLNRAMIQLSLRGKRNDIFWFTFFHEACHILEHKKSELFVDYDGHKDEFEDQADSWAADFLIPPQHHQTLKNYYKSGRNFSYEFVESFASSIGIAPGIVVGRLQHDRMLSPSHLNKLKRSYVWTS